MKWDKGPLDAAQTREWINRYQKNAKRYAWGFFIVLNPVVFGIIWASMGELNQDVVYSWAFFAVVTFLLAVFTRRKAVKSWVGNVVDKGIRERRIKRAEQELSDRIVTYHEVVVHTTRGKKQKIRCHPSYYEQMQVGDVVIKVPGFDWPVKADESGPQRICLACGQAVPVEEGNCPRCKAPKPDLATLQTLARS